MKYLNDWLLGILLTTGTGLIFGLLQSPVSVMSARSSLVSLAMVLWLSGFLLLPRASGLFPLLMNGAVPALVFLAGTFFFSPLPPSEAITTAFVLSLLLVLSFALEMLLAAWITVPVLRRSLVILGAAILSSTPLWLSPLTGLFHPGGFMTQAIINLSPLTHLSVALEFDYLRQDWMYRHSLLGSLRFSYPGLMQIMTALLSLVIVLLAVIRLMRGVALKWPESGKTENESGR